MIDRRVSSVFESMCFTDVSWDGLRVRVETMAVASLEGKVSGQENSGDGSNMNRRKGLSKMSF